MMNELLIIIALLLPLAWFMGYRNGKKVPFEQSFQQSADLSKKYFSGLNYLLNEQDDKAIDAFVSVLEVDSETVETHLALGNLYRKRGEVDRAIRIHQNLIARPSLHAQYRKTALFELGQDYMAAGLLDRAEHIYKELTEDQNHKQPSLKQLLQIYQQTKDWEKAIRVSEKIQPQNAPQIKTETAHFYCELAEMSMVAENNKEAMSYAKSALSVDPSNSRALLVSGNIQHKNGRFKLAIKAFRELMLQDIDFLPEAINNIQSSFLHLNDQKGYLSFLQTAIEKGAGITIILAYAEAIREQEGDRSSAEFIAKQLVKHPSIKGLLKLIDLHLEHASESAKPSLMMLKEVVSELLRNKPVYHCNYCGFDSKMLFWQCPSCKGWGRVKPIHGIEGE